MLLEESFRDDSREPLYGLVAVALGDGDDVVRRHSIVDRPGDVIAPIRTAIHPHFQIDLVTVSDNPLLGREAVVGIEFEALQQHGVHAEKCSHFAHRNRPLAPKVG